MARNIKQKAIITFALAYALWGFNTPMIKIGLQAVPVLPLLFVKFGGAGLFFILLAHRKWQRVPGKYWWRIIVATLFGYTLTTVFVYQGIKETGGLNGSLIYLIAPLLVYVLSIEVLRDKFSSKLLFGVSAGLLGAALIIVAPLLGGASMAHGNLHGNILVLLGVITDAASAIIIKPVLSKVPVLQMTAVRFVIAALSLLPFAGPQLLQLTNVRLTPATTAALLFNFVGATIIGYYLYHAGLSKISVEQSSPLYYLEPMVGAVASIFILNEHITTPVLTGVLLVVVGLYFSEIRTRSFAWRLVHHR